jgi:light-regulated signal transduction histidine kinase (bacteriophytochrome)
MLTPFMSLFATASILIAALLLAVLLLAALLHRARRATAALQRELAEHRRTEQELGALRQTLAQREAALKLELERAQRDLERTARDLEAICYSVSHDLAAPARKIHGFADLLREEAPALSDQGREWLDRIAHNSQQLGDMIADVLRLSRAGRQEMKLQTVDLNPLAAEVVAAAAAAYPQAQAEITPLPTVSCDRELVRQVLQNLVANAFKFSSKSASPRIEIGVRQEAGEPCLFVRDNGAGFNPRYADKLFGLFQRLHKESDFPGTGAGLAIARRIVQRHAGRIWAESAPGAGASFYFTLPQSGDPAGRGV